MIFKSQILTQASGSLGGITASRNKGGMYFRSRAIPTDPGTSFQLAMRNIMGNLATRWLGTLTAAQRLAWETYAANVTVPNALGEQIQLSGINHYLRSNAPRIQSGATRIDAAPTTFNLGEFTHPVASAASSGTGVVSIDYDNTDGWANEDLAWLLGYTSRQQNPTINYFRGPYRYAGSVEGDSVTPPTSPLALASPFALTQNNKVFARVQVSRADGRLSPPFRVEIIIGP